MNNEVKYSIIIPVYNKKNYIKNTIESLKRSDHCSIEFIIVNDGSTDGSGKLAQKEIAGDKRFSYFETKNKGVSEARNLGVEKSRGKYLLFVDADDLFESKILNYLDSLVEGELPDFIQYNLCHNNKKNKRIVTKMNTMSKEQLLSYMLKYEILNSVCTKCFKKNIILKNNISFKSGINMGEDLLFSLEYFLKANSFYFTEKIGYIYLTNIEDSLTNNYNNITRYDELDVVHDLMFSLIDNSKFSDNELVTESMLYLKEKRYFSELKNLIKTNSLSKEELKLINNNLSNYKSSCIKHSILKKILSILSVLAKF